MRLLCQDAGEDNIKVYHLVANSLGTQVSILALPSGSFFPASI
jgi:hypothetical protein